MTASAGPLPSIPAEAVTIDRLTRPHRYGYELQPIQGGSAAVMVLTPVTG